MKKIILISVIGLTFFCCLLQAQSHKIWWPAIDGGAMWRGSILSYNTLTDSLKEEHSFKRTHIGRYPMGGPLTLGPDSCIYGSTSEGGFALFSNHGNLFKYNPKDSSYQSLYFFDGTARYPFNGLIIDSTLNITGVCETGIFSYQASSGTFSLLHQWNVSTGTLPLSGMMRASNSLFYGVTSYGGMYDSGVLYSYDTLLNSYTVLHEFNTSYPIHPPIEYAPGILVGISPAGGGGSVGDIYQYNISTGVYTTLYSFNSSASIPRTSIIKGSDGKLYGTTFNGGSALVGTIFSYDISLNIFSILYNFPNSGLIGRNPTGSLIEDSVGVFYGITSAGATGGVGSIFKYNHNTLSCIEIHSLDQAKEGVGSATIFTKYIDGRLFAYSSNGLGSPSTTPAFEGAIFTIEPSTDTFHLEFDFEKTPEGAGPKGGLNHATDGNIYSVNLYGYQDPVLFKYNPSIDTLMLLKHFSNIGFHIGSNSYMFADFAEINQTLYSSIFSCDSFPEGAYYSYDIINDQLNYLVSFDTVSYVRYPSSLQLGANGFLYGTGQKKTTPVQFKYVLKINPTNMSLDTILRYSHFNFNDDLLFNLSKSKFTVAPNSGGIYNKGQVLVYDIFLDSIIYVYDLDTSLARPYSVLLVNDSTLICLTPFNTGGGYLYKIDMTTSTYSILHTFPQNVNLYFNENYFSDGYIYGIYYSNLANVLYRFDPISNIFSVLKTIPYTIGHSPDGRLRESSLFTGINDNEKENIATYLYPNPCSNFINIKNTKENCIIKVYDVFGKLVITSKTNQENTRLETGNLAPGLYLIQYIENKKTQTMKMVKN